MCIRHVGIKGYHYSNLEIPPWMINQTPRIAIREKF
jgi:hypothetical protein